MNLRQLFQTDSAVAILNFCFLVVENHQNPWNLNDNYYVTNMCKFLLKKNDFAIEY